MKHNEILAKITKSKGMAPTLKMVANALDLNPSTMRSRASRNADYSYEEMQRLQAYFNVRLIETNLIDKLVDGYIEAREQDENTSIDYYSDVFGSCGGGAFVLSETKEKLNVPKKIIKDYGQFKIYSVINAYGDSMQPTIVDKDLLVVEMHEGEQIRDNNVYVFRVGENIYVKRLVDNVNQIIIKSDNKDYDSIKLDKNNMDFQIVGRIVGLMRVF